MTAPNREIVTEPSGLAGSSARWTLASLRRVTSGGRFIPQIDGLRFVAIAAVVLYHINMYLLEKRAYVATDPGGGMIKAVEHGHYGVQLFFIISGLVLGMPFASHYLRGAKPVSLKTYFLRRLTRLEPPYVICLLLFFAMRVALLGQPASELFPHLAASLVYLHTMIFGTMSLINAVAWSLEVEIQFYIFVPLLARLYSMRSVVARRGIFVGLTLGFIAFQYFIGHGFGARFQLSILAHIQYFLLGLLLADIYVTDWKSDPQPKSRWDLVSLAGWPLLVVIWAFAPAAKWLFPPLAFALYCAAFLGARSRRVFANPLLTTIGGMCYTIYLLHYPIITNVASRLMPYLGLGSVPATYAAQVLIIVPVILGISAVYFALIEKPCMRPDWPRRLMARLRGAPLPAGG